MMAERRDKKEDRFGSAVARSYAARFSTERARAMSGGLNLIANDVHLRRRARRTGFLVKTEVELLERCQQLLDDEPLRLKLGAAGRERIKREFSRNRMLAELSRLYST